MSFSTPTPTVTGVHQRRTLPYIGDSDHDVFAFISNLAHQLQTASPLGPEAYGLTADDLAIIIAARDAYEIALPQAQNPATNSRTAVIAKNTARDEADRISRTYAQIIKNQPSHNVSDELKVLAGVRIEKTTRTPKGPPGTFPRLYIVHDGVLGLGSNVKLRFRDDALGTGRMPREDGVTHVVVYAKIAPPPPVAASAMQVIAHATRNPFRVRFDASLLARFGLRPTSRDDGAAEFRSVTVMFRGQWLNAKGEVGPLGPAAMFNVPVSGGGVVAIGDLRDESEGREMMKLAA